MRKVQPREAIGGDGEGFTLIELLVVVVILGVLIAIAIPVYLSYRQGANDRASQQDLRGTVSVLEQCLGDNASYPAAATFTPGPATALCTGRTVSVSGGTTLKYFPAPTPTAYIVGATNSGGSGKVYCFANTGGGAIATASAVPSYRAAC